MGLMNIQRNKFSVALTIVEAWAGSDHHQQVSSHCPSEAIMELRLLSRSKGRILRELEAVNHLRSKISTTQKQVSFMYHTSKGQ